MTGNAVSQEFKGRWIPHVLERHGYTDSFEICVIREDFEHGRESYGWYGPAKVLVVEGDISKSAWRTLEPAMRKAAQELADKFNRKEATK